MMLSERNPSARELTFPRLDANTSRDTLAKVLGSHVPYLRAVDDELPRICRVTPPIPPAPADGTLVIIAFDEANQYVEYPATIDVRAGQLPDVAAALDRIAQHAAAPFN